VVDAWPTLPDAIRRAVLAMIASIGSFDSFDSFDSD